ncbi:MAG: hypothetical protein E7651_07315 [Ruminococcaceae bacterium]|nr:hypothetical protein [Oscillospiraceae bacterium]
MKKLSLLLAALMIFCCFALASCGEEEATSSAPEASSTAPATSSEAPAVSSEEPEASSEEPAESSEEELPLVGEAEMFWVTHFNDGTAEGAGAIFTETDTAGGWWIHVAFAPAQVEDLENVYEIVELTNGIADGSATTVAVPEGGFVWAINVGNDYITLGSGDTDFTSPNCNAMVASAQLWRVGDKMQFTGLDLEGLTVPTETADTMWYDDAYVCTATWAPIND